MKNVIVNLGVSCGYSCDGEGHGTEDELSIEVEDSIGAEIQKLLTESSPLDQDKIATLIDNGCSYLVPIVEAIDKRSKDLNSLYWIQMSKEYYNPNVDTLEKYIVNTLANGRWHPSMAPNGESKNFDDMKREFQDWLDNQPIEEQLEAYDLLPWNGYRKEYEIVSIKNICKQDM